MLDNIEYINILLSNDNNIIIIFRFYFNKMLKIYDEHLLLFVYLFKKVNMYS